MRARHDAMESAGSAGMQVPVAGFSSAFWRLGIHERSGSAGSEAAVLRCETRGRTATNRDGFSW